MMFALVTTRPLAALGVAPAVMSRVAPTLRARFPTVRRRPVAPFWLKTILLPPEATVRRPGLEMVWESVMPDLPKRVNVPPFRVTEPVLGRIFVALVVKSSVTPPALMSKPPVKVFWPESVSVPVPTLETEPAPEITPAKAVLVLPEPMAALPLTVATPLASAVRLRLRVT